MRRTGEAGLELIQHFEGFRLQSYQDSVGVWTIGYGSTRGVTAGMFVTEEEANALLRHDLRTAESAVLRLIAVQLTPCQFDALVSFTFNLGGGALQRSTLRRKVNREDHEDVPAEFLRWCRAGGRILPGLLRRRQAEARLYAA